jgi:hypothetical protein
MIGENGGQYYDSTAELTGFWYMIEPQEDTVISVLEETGDVDVMSEWNISARTLKHGAILTPYRENFTKIAITSGSVILRKA